MISSGSALTMYSVAPTESCPLRMSEKSCSWRAGDGSLRSHPSMCQIASSCQRICGLARSVAITSSMCVTSWSRSTSSGSVNSRSQWDEGVT